MTSRAIANSVVCSGRQIVFVSAIKGTGDTRFVVIVTIITALLFVGIGSYGATLFNGPDAKVNWWCQPDRLDRASERHLLAQIHAGKMA